MALALADPLVESVQAPGLRWEAVQSEHFVVHYSVERGREGRSDRRGAERVLAEAEALWLPLCDAVDYFPVEQAHVLLLPDDAVNGWTWPAWDWIVLSDHPGGLLERLRGPMDPVRLVLRHELGHYLTLKKAKRVAEPVEVGDLSVALRHGPSNVTVEASLGLSALGPHWWSEGAAEWSGVSAGLATVSVEQLQTLGAAVEEQRLLGDAWNTRAGKDSWGDSERSYQQGLAFLQWLEKEEGLDLALLTEEVGRRAGVRPALRALTGKNLDELQGAFLQSLGGRASVVRAPDPGAWELWPIPLGERLAHHGGGHLLVEERSPDTVTGLGGEASWRPRLVVPIAYGSRPTVVGDTAVVVGQDALRTGIDLSVRDIGALFAVDLTGPWESEPWRIRRRARELPGTEHGIDPTLSADGTELAWVQAIDGGGVLMRGPVDGPYQAVAGGPGEWWRTPVFLPDGNLVAIHRIGDQADIARIDADGVRTLTESEAAEADLSVTPSGQVLFTADVDGSRDVFLLDPETEKVFQLTDHADQARAFHTPALTLTGDLLVAAPSATGFRMLGIPAAALLSRDRTDLFREERPRATPIRIPEIATARPHTLTPLALTPFLSLGMSAANDLDLAAGLSAGTRSYTDATDVHGAFWLGEEAGASLGLRQRIGPVQLETDAGWTVWERPVRGTKIEGWRGWAAAGLGFSRGDTRTYLGGRAGEVGIRGSGVQRVMAGVGSFELVDARRADLAVEGFEVGVGAEAGTEGRPYVQGWFHWDGATRVPSSLRGPWRQHHVVLSGLDILASTPVHPWLQPRAGGLASERILGQSIAFPGYPELAVVSDALLVAKLGYRVPVARWYRAVGPYLAEGMTLEVDGRLGVAGDRLPGDLSGRLVLRGSVRDARWDLALRVAAPLAALPVQDVDGDDVFDPLIRPPAPREERRLPRVWVEVGRVR